MDFLFKNLKLIEEYLHLLQIKDHIISSNISNLETPFYKNLQMEILFNQDISLRINHYKHIPNKTNFFSYKIIEKKNTLIGLDNNNIDLEEELLNLEKVALTYKTLLKFLQSKFSSLELVIKGGG